MGKFDIFKKFSSGVIIINEKKEVVFRNNAFSRVFPDFENLSKFSHKLDYEMYALEISDRTVHSPILQALASKEDFSAFVKYQTSADKYAYYNVNSSKKGNYTIIVFTDVTAEINLEDYVEQNKKFLEKIYLLEAENKNLLKIKQQAQSQAMKLLLLNNISNIIRSSADTRQIINSALNELSGIFGAFRAYYAVYAAESDCYIINQSAVKKDIGVKIAFDKDTEKQINRTKAFSSPCMKEFVEAKPFKELVQRVVMPIFHLNTKLGVLVILTRQKASLSDTLEVLDGVSLQLGNAIIREETRLQLINSEKMASLGQLVAGVAHEINTPLASIKSNNEIIKKLINNLSGKNIELLDEINSIDKEAIDRINRIVVSLRKFVRLDEADLQEADINKELDLTLDLIRHVTKNRINIVKHYGKIPPIKCYPGRLNQVFMNILVNACHAIEREGTITIDTGYIKNELIVKIKDTGCGIKEPDKIFFAGYTTKGVGVGTGLGLAISQKIIEEHNGKIKVNTKVGEGSEFVITIPSE